MVKCKQWVVLIGVFGLVRATHHLVRVTILAVLGLAGLYMLHTLAQDFQKIYQQIQNGHGPGRAILNTIANNPIYKNIRNNVGKTIADTLASGSSFRQANQRKDDVRKTLCSDGLINYCDPKDINEYSDKGVERYNSDELFGGYYREESGSFKNNDKYKGGTISTSDLYSTKPQDWGFTVGKSYGSSVGYVLKKRSVSSESSNSAEDDSIENLNYPEINWEKVLRRDPASCARSLVCQLAATPKNKLELDEESILAIVRIATRKKDWASNQLREALEYGENVKSVSHCEKYYLLCPYSGRTMMKILRFFGGSS